MLSSCLRARTGLAVLVASLALTAACGEAPERETASSGGDSGPKVQLLGSGVSVPWVQEAAMILGSEWGVSADVWSVTSWIELRRDGLAAEKHNFLHPDEQPQVPYVTRRFADAQGPVIASTDYMSAVPDQIRQFLPNRFATLGADDHGFSDTRAAARRYFHIDVHSIVVRALQELAAAVRARRRVGR